MESKALTIDTQRLYKELTTRSNAVLSGSTKSMAGSAFYQYAYMYIKEDS